MCKGKSICLKLGQNRKSWSSTTPLSQPESFQKAYLNILEIEELICKKKLTKAIAILNNALADEIKEWFIEHAQNAWYYRTKTLDRIDSVANPGILDPRKLNSKIKLDVFERDNYVCQYCKGKLIPDSRLIQLSKTMGIENFRITGTNAQRHGYVYILRPTADHVVPQSRGGFTNLDNLVTSCWACNYGKAEKTLFELDLLDPRTNLNLT